MAMRRFTRLTNAVSKKLENHAHMVAVYALWYNFARIHKTLRTSPAMASGIETRLWSMEDVVRLVTRNVRIFGPARFWSDKSCQENARNDENAQLAFRPKHKLPF
jgi:hypothetical protein